MIYLSMNRILMLRQSVFATIISFMVAACTTTDRPKPDIGPDTKYEQIEQIQLQVDDLGYELPPVFAPQQVLPAELVQSEYHTVGEKVSTDGFTNTYILKSDFGTQVVHGTGKLRERVHEIEVLAALMEYDVNNAEVYALAVANAVENPIEGAVQLIIHPIRTLSGIPKGMWAYGSRIVEMTEGGRTSFEDTYAEELIGFSTSKREWAYRLGVNVYSSNRHVQEVLNKYAWTAFAGGMTVRLPLIFVTGAADIVLTVTSAADDTKRILRNKTPEALRKSNEDKWRPWVSTN